MELSREGRAISDEWAAEVEPVPEFGPFRFLGDWAFAHYAEGRSQEALRACADALALVEAAGDAETARFLRYITCAVYERDGQWSRLRQASQDLLDRLGADAGPYWRAKALGMLGDSLIQQGRSATALDTLAEAYELVMDHPGATYHRASACMAVAKPLYSALLFEPAVKLVRVSKRIVSSPTIPGIAASITEANILGVWGLFLELLGRRAEADRRYAACPSAAVLAGDLARAVGVEQLQLQAAALLQFAYQRLGCGPIDRGVLQLHADTDRMNLLLPRLALASEQARSGEVAQARAQLAAVRVDAQRLGEPVQGWAATAWLAELEEAEHGETETTRRWRALAIANLERLWLDRVGRFEHVVVRGQVAQLMEQVTTDTGRLWADPLTGVGNRRLLDELLAHPDTARRPVTFIDVDEFKVVNDQHGHEVGDEVLVRIAALISASCGPGDVVVRYGGDEFVVLLAGGDVAVLAERIRRAVAQAAWRDLAAGLHVTVTVGTSSAGPGAVERADKDLLARRERRMAAVRPVEW